MSLEDKFYPEDGTFLTYIDNSLIKCAGKVGESYQQITGQNAKELYRHVLFAGMCMSVASAVFGNYLMGPFYGNLMRVAREKPRFQSPLEEKLEHESCGDPRQLSAALRAIVTAMGCGLITYTLSSAQQYHGDKNDFMTIGAFSLFGTALVALGFAQYLSKSKIPKPPEKHIFARIGDKLKVALPQVAPEPIVG